MTSQAGALSDRGSTWQWRKLRKMVLDRDAWTCRHCHTPVHARNLCPGRGCQQCAHVDHWPVPRWAGGPDDPANLVASCRGCNLSPRAKATAGKTDKPTTVPPCPPGKNPGIWPQSRDW